jgi:hypothetical protein
MSKIPADVMKAARAAYKELAGDSEYADTHIDETTAAFARAIMAERERCAAFAFAKYDWPARWIASSFRGENSAYHDFEVPE